jgi:Uma2 family endonuclease
MAVTTPPRADRVVLHNLSWQQFERLLEDIGERRGARVAYDRGTLEIMTPLPEHERYNDRISDAIKDIAEIFNIEYDCLGSTTWKREAKLAGVEPDNCFYFQNESRVRGLSRFDLDRDPPPDLALEIDLTHKSLNRLPIYARLGVCEVWNYDVERGELTIYRLNDGEYAIAPSSGIFPQLPIVEIPQLLNRHRSEGRLATRHSVRDWARSHLG